MIKDSCLAGQSVKQFICRLQVGYLQVIGWSYGQVMARIDEMCQWDVLVSSFDFWLIWLVDWLGQRLNWRFLILILI